MCGISAIISLGNNVINKDHIVSMSNLIKHRGPDDEGYLLIDNENLPHVYGGKDTPDSVLKEKYDGNPQNLISIEDKNIFYAAFGHRRLSILDLSPTGHQPMCYSNKRYWITYNGEIYNYIDVKNELVKNGYKFRSKSDTEVIMAAYDFWGVDCLHHFNGMFAFIIVDLVDSRLFIARDRFGVKPIYYWYIPERFVAFASEIKQFTALPYWNPCLNGQRAYDFLCWALLDHTSETLFKDVYQIKGGEAAEISLDELRYGHIKCQNKLLPIKRWYNLIPADRNDNFSDASSALKELLFDSVSLRLKADVSVGSCLSGGLDSSSIVSIASLLLQQENHQNALQTFSSCALDKRFDEREYIDEVVANNKIDAHYTYPSVEVLFKELDKVLWHQDEPFSTTSIFAEWQVFKLAANMGNKVVFSGQGSDEYLAGYDSFHGAYLATLFINTELKSLFKELKCLKKNRGYSYFYSLQLLANSVLPEIIRTPLRNIFKNHSSIPDWLNLKALHAFPDKHLEIKDSGVNVKMHSIMQLHKTSLPVQLHWEDRDSMANSVESRQPFLDFRIIEFILSLPDDYLLKNGISKRILRESMKGILPESIRKRADKMGFVTPEEIWLKDSGKDIFRNEILDAVNNEAGIINISALDKLNSILNNKEEFNFVPWRIISFNRWLKIFNVKTSNTL